MGKQTYRVKPGQRFGVGKRLGPGDTVQLTEAEAQGFLDKLELVPELLQSGGLVVNPNGDLAGETGAPKADGENSDDGDRNGPKDLELASVEKKPKGKKA